MKKLLLIVSFFTYIFAQPNLKNLSVIELFKKQYYTYICMHRWIYINKYEKKREDLLSLVAYSCLKKHFLTPALDLSKVLRMTKEGRINSTYITTLFMMKLLLIQYLNNENSLLEVTLPKINNDLLAHVFYLIQKQKPEVKNYQTEVSDDEKHYIITYKPYINNIIIDIYQNGKLIKKEKYW